MHVIKDFYIKVGLVDRIYVFVFKLACTYFDSLYLFTIVMKESILGNMSFCYMPGVVFSCQGKFFHV